MKFFPLGILAVITFLGASCSEDRADSGEGLAYKLALVEAIRRADKIVVLEHSDDLDLIGKERLSDAPMAKVVYGSVELNGELKKSFLLDVEKMDPRTQDAFAACEFIPHHTIQFFEGGEAKSSMQICFQCGEVMWDGSQKVNPWAILSTVRPTIDAVGFSEKRDWRKLLEKNRGGGDVR